MEELEKINSKSLEKLFALSVFENIAFENKITINYKESNFLYFFYLFCFVSIVIFSNYKIYNFIYLIFNIKSIAFLSFTIFIVSSFLSSLVFHVFFVKNNKFFYGFKKEKCFKHKDRIISILEEELKKEAVKSFSNERQNSIYLSALKYMLNNKNLEDFGYEKLRREALYLNLI